MERREVLILSLSLLVPVLRPWPLGESPCGSPLLPDDGNREPSGVVSDFYNPPLTQTALYNSIGSPNLTTTFIYRKLSPRARGICWELQNWNENQLFGPWLEFSMLYHSLFSPDVCLLGQNLRLHPGRDCALEGPKA